MVNFKKLADRAQLVKGQVEKQIDQQGGTDALKVKAQRMKTAASGPGSVSDKAKAAAQVAREKPNPATDVAGDDVASGPIGGGAAPPKVASAEPAAATGTAAESSPAEATTESTPAATATAAPTATATATAAPTATADEDDDPAATPVEDAPTDPPSTPPAPEPDDAKPSEPEDGDSKDR